MGLLFFGVVIVHFLTLFLCFLGPVSSWVDSTTDIYCYQMFFL
jgi:hypothetical protein